jgi:hypothetical protein
MIIDSNIITNVVYPIESYYHVVIHRFHVYLRLERPLDPFGMTGIACC